MQDFGPKHPVSLHNSPFALWTGVNWEVEATANMPGWGDSGRGGRPGDLNGASSVASPRYALWGKHLQEQSNWAALQPGRGGKRGGFGGTL